MNAAAAAAAAAAMKLYADADVINGVIDAGAGKVRSTLKVRDGVTRSREASKNNDNNNKENKTDGVERRYGLFFSRLHFFARP